MSKKSIVFKMPATDPAPDGDEAVTAETPFVAPSRAVAPRLARAAARASEPERWVSGPDSSAAAPPSRASGRLVIDLDAERDLTQVAALALAAPAMLYWCWLTNAMSHYRRMFAG